MPFRHSGVVLRLRALHLGQFEGLLCTAVKIYGFGLQPYDHVGFSAAGLMKEDSDR